ncbi:MAG: phenylalanine-4-hydroxylase [Alphaproteobacteria bacterium]|jgi:phenylalanine-4-hydroxylase
MAKGGKYVSKEAGSNGIRHYTEEENLVWRDLVLRQKEILPGLVCNAYMHGLDVLDLPVDRVPQLSEINEKIKKETNFEIEAVPALISPERFFGLLAQRKFPVATFIRTREGFDYLQEPDIFHEIWGHCPMLTNQTYTNFLQKYGELALKLDSKYIWMMQRLFWFTVEFGLIDEGKGPLIYGAGIVSSAGESPYSIHSDEAERRPFDIVDVFRTPYRIDIFQKVYFSIRSYDELYELLTHDLVPLMEEALKLGMHKPRFPPKEEG